MRIDLRQNMAVVSHGTAKLVFNWKYYSQKLHPEQIFGPINEYFEQLPIEKQATLFSYYSNIYGIFYNAVGGMNSTHEETMRQLTDRVGDFYQHIDFDHLRNWCNTNSSFQFPPDLKNDYGNYDEVTTYLHTDYRGLLFLATVLKPMTLIWGDFINRFKDEFGTKHKELVSLPLISKSGIFDLPEYDKLKRYVMATTANAVGTLNSNLNGLGTAGLSDWGMAAIVVRRMAAGIVTDSNVSLIRLIHGHLDNGVNKTSTLENIDGRMRYYERTPPSGLKGGREEDRTSVIDSYRLRQAQPDHVAMITEVFLQDMFNVAKSIDNTIDLTGMYGKLLSESTVKAYSDMEIREFHIRLCSIVSAEVIGPKNLPCIQYLPLLRLILVTQALLHHWGFHSLAHLMSANTREMDLDIISDVSSIPMPTEVVEKLSALYCHWQSRTRTEAKNPKPLLNNYGMVFIKDVMEDLNLYVWRYNSQSKLYSDKTLHGTHMDLPRDARTQLALLLIKTRS